MPLSRSLRATAFLALAGVVLLGGCSALKLRESARLVKESEPFQADPPDPSGSLLIVGDSTAVGTGASNGRASLAGLLSTRYPRLRIVNLAVNGAKYRDFAQQLRSSQGRFDTVLVLGGGNDVLRLTSERRLRQDVATAAKLARERGQRVILMPPGNVGNAPFFYQPLSAWMTRRSQMLHAVVRETAAAQGVIYVSLYQPKETDPFALRPAQMHSSDGLHPSDDGYAMWVGELMQQAAGGFASPAMTPVAR